DPETAGSEHDAEAGDKWDTASDIAPRISVRRYSVHPVRLCHVSEHGVIEYKARGISGLRQHKHAQKPDPGRQKSQKETAEHPHAHGNTEYSLLKVLCIR